MRASLYANPLFAAGLSQVLGDFLGGNPQEAAMAEYYAARAGNENDTRRYREEMGTAGDANDLAGMLVRSLQAGREYSGEGPEIAEAIMGVPSGYGGLADVMGHAIMGQPRTGGGGGRRGGGGAAAPKVADPRTLTAGGRSALIKGLGDAVDPNTALAIVAQAEDWLSANPGMSENDALAYASDPANFERGPETVDESLLPFGWGDETVPGPVTGLRIASPAAAAPATAVGDDAAGALEEARQAIAAGAPRAAVIARLREMGIDPAGL